ncbi:MAG: DUF2332 family protein, partial [Alphaproteobacteria bacterium]|nr:DUF2332 family protein [Alphaproteobacteria bacterium]
MSAAVREAFRGQAGHCAALGSPFMARLMTLLAERLTPGTPVADRILTWQGDPAPEADSLPLRLGGALHALKLEGRALAEVYPPHDVPDDDLWAVVAKALTLHAGHITGWLQSPPQTNEVRRSAALIP